MPLFLTSGSFSFTNPGELTSALERALVQLRQGYAATVPAEPPDKDVRGWYRRQVQRWLGKLPHLTRPEGMPLEFCLYLAPDIFSTKTFS